MKIIEYWWDNYNKVFSIRFYKQHWKLFHFGTNGWRKGVDPCYDLNIHAFGIFISYTRFNCKIDNHLNK